MGGQQFIRYIRRDNGTKKKEELRKRVVEKQQLEATKWSKVSLEDVKKNASEGKVVSQSCLRALVLSDPSLFSKTLYKKDELKVLFKGYELKFVQSAESLRRKTWMWTGYLTVMFSNSDVSEWFIATIQDLIITTIAFVLWLGVVSYFRINWFFISHLTNLYPFSKTCL